MATTDRIYGLHTVRTLLRKNPRQIRRLWFQEGREDQRLATLQAAGRDAGIPSQAVPRSELDILVPGERHQGIVAEVESTPLRDEQQLISAVKALQEPPLLLVLDGVQDPHNLGACLRSAVAAGVHGVVIPKNRSVGVTPVVRKVASGAAEVAPIYTVINLARVLGRLKQEAGIWIYGASREASTSLYDMDLSGPAALVMGGEQKGLRRLTREHCDDLFAIPMEGSVESLNVSVAAGIIMFEARRQRL